MEVKALKKSERNCWNYMVFEDVVLILERTHSYIRTYYLNKISQVKRVVKLFICGLDEEIAGIEVERP